MNIIYVSSTCSREKYADRAKIYGEKEYSRTVNTIKYVELFKEIGEK